MTRDWLSKTSHWINQWAGTSLDLLLPRRCAGCNEILCIDGAFCPACEPSVQPIHAYCLQCALPDEGPICPACQTSPPLFRSARAAFVYGGQLASAIRAIKYHQASHLCCVLGKSLRPYLHPVPKIDAVIPVPLHPARLIQRGYNPAALLAIEAVRTTRIPVLTTALRRIKSTISQSGLNRNERQRNVEGAFVALARNMAGKTLLLLDDVMTTGATVSACTQALLEAGAHSVHVLTLARALP